MRTVILLFCACFSLQNASGFVQNTFGFVHRAHALPPMKTSCRCANLAVVHGVAATKLTSPADATFRQMKEVDVAEIVRLYVREYGSTTTTNPHRPFTLFPPMLHRYQWAQFCDNFILACILYLALYQRLGRKWMNEHDHQVWVLCSNEQVVGVAEFSLEAPGRTALPIGLPVGVKKLLFRTGTLQPYVSNVVIKESCRGCGYGTVLLQKLEQQAHQHHHQELTLHVDANATAARSLYNKLGYTVEGKGSAGMLGRIFCFWAGLYFLPETELLYMRKDLS